jgi:soluble lytic murein transglycosylase
VDGIALRQPPKPDPCYQPAQVGELVRAAEMLYAIGERDVVLYFAADLAEQSADTAALNARYRTLYPQYVEFLRANGLSVKHA